MSETTNLQLFKHDNPSTNTNPFNVETALNENWDKIDAFAGNTNSELNTARGTYNSLNARFEADEANITNNTTKVNKKVYYHTNIANMKADNSLSAGDVVQTLGYYAADDGGQGLYQIVDDDTLVDDGGSVHELTSGLKAKLIIENFVNVRQMGAKGDGTTDDTAKIQLAFNKYKNIFISDGTYMINAETSVFPKSNSYIKLSGNATLKAITNSRESYDIIKFDNVSNIIFEGGTVEGDRETHTGSSGEWGMGIAIRNSSENINIKDITAKNCWGDGLYINTAKNIKTQNIICDNNRRQGLSIISVDTYHSLNDSFINTKGTDPQAGVDIEPNYSTDILKNIVFENPYTENNWGPGISIFITPSNFENDIDIKIINHTDLGSGTGFNIKVYEDVSGNIEVINPKYENNRYQAIFGNGFISENCKLSIKKPHIINPCKAGSSELLRTWAIVFMNDITSKQDKYTQNIYLYNVYLEYSGNGAISFVNNPLLKNCYLINPIKLEKRHQIRAINELFLYDKFEQAVYDGDTNATLSQTSIKSLINNVNYTSNRTITFDNTFPINTEIKMININENYPMKIQLKNTLYCRQLSSTAGIIIYLRNYGESITLKRIDATNVIITNVVGNPTLT